MGCQPRCDVTYIRTVVVVGIEYYYVDDQVSLILRPASPPFLQD